MKICILATGVIRPTVERVIKNISTTYNAFKKTNHEIDFHVVTYKDHFEKEIREKIPEYATLHFLNPITKEIGAHVQVINSYRMVKSIELSHKLIKNLDDFDVVVRHRIDHEVNSLKVPKEIKADTYYSAPCDTSGIYDNFGLCCPKLFRLVWDSNFKDRFTAKNNEAMLLNQVRRLNAKLEVINFETTGYQSADETWNGIRQWSKRDRKWISREGDEDIARLRLDK